MTSTIGSRHFAEDDSSPLADHLSPSPIDLSTQSVFQEQAAGTAPTLAERFSLPSSLVPRPPVAPISRPAPNKAGEGGEAGEGGVAAATGAAPTGLPGGTGPATHHEVAPAVADLDPSLVTNDAFIDAIFKKVSAGATPVVCIKTGDPTSGGWKAQAAADVVGRWTKTTNNYVNCASFRRQDEGTVAARKDSSAACHALLLDDVGTKIPVERLKGFEVSWLIETSPNNHRA